MPQLLSEPVFCLFVGLTVIAIIAACAGIVYVIRSHIENKQIDALCTEHRKQEQDDFLTLFNNVKNLCITAELKGLKPNLLVIGIRQKLIFQDHYFYRDKKCGDKVSIACRKLRLLITSESDFLAVYEKRPFSWLS